MARSALSLWGAGVVWLTLLSSMPSSAAAMISFEQLVHGLWFAPNAVQAEFARVALVEMARAHDREAARSRRLGAGSARWAAGVAGYNAGLRALAASLTPETMVSLRRGRDGLTQLLVDDTVVIISGPRVAEQARFEQGIVVQFCDRYLCSELLADASRVQAETEGVTFGLNIAADAGLSCRSSDGLELLFYTRDDLEGRRRWCRQIVAELRGLAWAINQQITAGVPVQWQHFAIARAYDAVDDGGVVANTVRLNRAGDSLLMALPHSAAAPRLIDRLLPWLMTRAEGLGHQGIVLVITNTESLIDSPEGDCAEDARPAPAWR